jgi:hypothetical protein
MSFKVRDDLRKLLFSVVATVLMQPMVRAEESSAPANTPAGTIVGIVTNSAKLPVAHATVTAKRVDGAGIRATISGSDGVYSFADLPAGLWSVSSQADGLPEVTEPSIAVAPSKATRHDIVMNAPQATPATAGPALAAVAAEAAKAAKSARTVPAAAPTVPTVPEALQAPEPPPENDTVTPFANVGDTSTPSSSRPKSAWT